MKKLFSMVALFFIIIPFVISAEPGSRDSANLTELGKIYDKQILELYTDIQKLIAEGKFMENKDIKSLPYQSELNYGPDPKSPQYIELTKHIYNRSTEFGGEVIGYEEKRMQIYTDGKSVTKLVTIIHKKNFRSLDEEMVTMTDPSPMSEGTDDITLSHVYNKKVLIKDKKLSEVENTLDSPIRNNVKIQFIIPNLAILNNMLVFITEVNSKDTKDADKKMAEFLKKAVLY